MPSHPASCRRGFARHLPAEQHRTNPGDVRTVSIHPAGPARAVQDRRDAEVEDLAGVGERSLAGAVLRSGSILHGQGRTLLYRFMRAFVHLEISSQLHVSKSVCQHCQSDESMCAL